MKYDDSLLLYASLLNQNKLGLYEPKELVAMTNVYATRQFGGLSIQINIDENRHGLPYFKVYNNFQYSKATKMQRIAFKSASYIVHRNNNGKDPWYLTMSQRKTLMTILESRPFYNKTFTLWQRMIITYNSDKFQLNEEDTMNCTVANYHSFIRQYTALGYLHLIDVLPIDLPMPDYTKLK